MCVYINTYEYINNSTVIHAIQLAMQYKTCGARLGARYDYRYALKVRLPLPPSSYAKPCLQMMRFGLQRL